jgi:flagellar basal body-associated protein FliL
MDPKKKKIYIAIIVICFSLTGGILYWGFFSSGGSSSNVTLPPPVDQGTGFGGDASQQATNPDGTTSYSTPSVFPDTTDFKTDVLDSDAYKKLVPYSAVDVTGQLGRSDPFKNF